MTSRPRQSRLLYSMDPRRRRTRHTRRLVLGSLIIFLLFAGSLLIFFMDDLLAAFDRTYPLYVVMPGATGLVAESPVWVSGREVGRVTSIGLLPAGNDTLARILISVELPVSVQSQVRTDSEVRLTSIGPISERVVDISAGSAAAAVIASGDTLLQATQVTGLQLTDRALIVKANLDTALAALQTHAPAIRARLQQTERAFAGLEAVMGEAGRLQIDLDANPGMALLRDPSFAASLEATRAHAAELPLLIGRLRDSTGPAAEVRTALARLQLRADSVQVQLAAAAAALDNPNGTLARIRQDTALLRALNDARAQLDSLIADMRSNPLRYVY
jgi:phospholipid/cholesterol/gamma-HCH transport system substrate-binding protein